MVHDDPFLQPPSDKTLIVPSPGGRSSRPAAAQNERPASGVRFDRVELGSLDWSTGLNPLIAAANFLQLNLAVMDILLHQTAIAITNTHRFIRRSRPGNNQQ